MRIQIVIVFFLILFCNPLQANICSSLFKINYLKWNNENTHLQLIQNIQKLEDIVEKELRKSLYLPFCWHASVILKKQIKLVYNVDTVMVGSTINNWSHYLLIIPNYFSRGNHLYIDPTIQQFAYNFITPKMFVGSHKDLIDFVQATQIKEGNQNFIEEYIGLKSYDENILPSFDNKNY